MSESSSCANCDVQIPAGARSCDNCGMPVSETVPPQEEEEDSPPRKDPAGQAPPSPTPPPRSSPPPPPPVGQPLSFLPPTQKAQQNEGEQPRKRTGTIVLVVLALI